MIFRLPPPLPFPVPNTIYSFMLDYRSLIEMENITWRELRVIFVSLPTPFFHPNLSHSHHLKFYFFFQAILFSFPLIIEIFLKKKVFIKIRQNSFKLEFPKFLSRKFISHPSPLFFFLFILISSTIFSRSRFEFDRSLHDHPSKRWIVRYDAPNDILCSNNSRVFHSLAGELA